MNHLPSYAWPITGRAGIATQTLALRIWAQNYGTVCPQDQAATRAYGGRGSDLVTEASRGPLVKWPHIWEVKDEAGQRTGWRCSPMPRRRASPYLSGEGCHHPNSHVIPRALSAFAFLGPFLYQKKKKKLTMIYYDGIDKRTNIIQPGIYSFYFL